MKKSGFIVETKDGKIGRTFNIQGMIKGKIPVYLETEKKGIYNTTGTLCDPKTLKRIGFID